MNILHMLFLLSLVIGGSLVLTYLSIKFIPEYKEKKMPEIDPREIPIEYTGGQDEK